MKLFVPFLTVCGLLYVGSFAVVHIVPGLRRPSLDGDWYYSDIELLESAEFYAFWPLRQVGYPITVARSRHISEFLPLGMPDGLPTTE